MNPKPALEAFFSSPDGQVADVTCVGPSPFENVLCLGFEDGSMRFLDLERREWSIPHPLSPSQEAVNGFAAIPGKSLAVSTPAQVSFLQFLPDRPIISHFPHGAHGVIATHSGTYVAPLGHTGLLFVQPTPDGIQEMFVAKPTEQNLYCYHTLVLHDGAGNEYLTIAHRDGGIGICPYTSRSIMRFTDFKDDIVDLCLVSDRSLELIAIASSGELYYIADVSTVKLLTATLPELVGQQVYSVSVISDHVVIQTSRKIYLYEQLVQHLRTGYQSGHHQNQYHVHTLPLETTQLFIHDHEYILAVLGENAVETLSISELLYNRTPAVAPSRTTNERRTVVPFDLQRPLDPFTQETNPVTSELQAA